MRKLPVVLVATVVVLSLLSSPRPARADLSSLYLGFGGAFGLANDDPDPTDDIDEIALAGGGGAFAGGRLEIFGLTGVGSGAALPLGSGIYMGHGALLFGKETKCNISREISRTNMGSYVAVTSQVLGHYRCKYGIMVGGTLEGSLDNLSPIVELGFGFLARFQFEINYRYEIVDGSHGMVMRMIFLPISGNDITFGFDLGGQFSGEVEYPFWMTMYLGWAWALTDDGVTWY